MRQRKPNPKTEQLLAERAYGMRHSPTASEAALFRMLSAKKLGAQFRRQVPLAGRYVADFVAPTKRLIIELDGASHKKRASADARRDRVLRRLGYRVLRLEAKLVFQQPERVLARIRQALAEGRIIVHGRPVSDLCVASSRANTPRSSLLSAKA